MVETVIMMRRFADLKQDVQVIVALLQQLSEKHLAMNRLVSGGSTLFINDEKWRKANLTVKIRLPLFVAIGDKPE